MSAQAGQTRSRYYVAIDEGWRFKPKVQRLVSLTNLSPQAICGTCQEFWEWVQREGVDHEGDTGLLPGIDRAAITRLFGVDNTFLDALADPQVDWVRFTGEGIVIPGFAKRFSRQARRRQQDRERKQDQRAAERSATETTWQDRASVFDSLQREDLGRPQQLLSWFEMAARQPSPLVELTEHHLVVVIAAGRISISSTNGRKKREPLAYFRYLVGKCRKRWGDSGLFPEGHMNEARRIVRDVLQWQPPEGMLRRSVEEQRRILEQREQTLKLKQA